MARLNPCLAVSYTILLHWLQHFSLQLLFTFNWNQVGHVTLIRRKYVKMGNFDCLGALLPQGCKLREFYSSTGCTRTAIQKKPGKHAPNLTQVVGI